MQLYPATRTATMDITDLQNVMAFAQADLQDDSVRYDGMDRSATVDTAKQTVRDTVAALQGKARTAKSPGDALAALRGTSTFCGLHGSYTISPDGCPRCRH